MRTDSNSALGIAQIIRSQSSIVIHHRAFVVFGCLLFVVFYLSNCIGTKLNIYTKCLPAPSFKTSTEITIENLNWKINTFPFEADRRSHWVPERTSSDSGV